MMDTELFQRFKDGDNRSFTSYFEQYGKSLLFFAYNIVSNEDIAEEVVQDAYIKLWNTRTRIENNSHLKSFLYKTVRNACIDHLRSSKIRTWNETVELDDNMTLSDNDMLAHMIHAETLRLVYQEVKKLSPTQQRVFHMTYIDGLSTEEICLQLDMTPNAVFIARSKALNTLQRIFKNKAWLYYLSFLQLLERWQSMN